MQFELSEEQSAYVASAREFAQAEFRPNAAHWDESSLFPKSALKAAGDLGFMGDVYPGRGRRAGNVTAGCQPHR